MPISRIKSCKPCRVAKARCSLVNPCSRCTERGLQCHYPPPPSSRHEPYTTIQRRIRCAADRTARENFDKESSEAGQSTCLEHGSDPVTTLVWLSDEAAGTAAATDSTLVHEESDLNLFDTEVSVNPFLQAVGSPMFPQLENPFFQSYTQSLSIPSPLSVMPPSIERVPAEQANSCGVLVRVGGLSTGRQRNLLSSRYPKKSEAFLTAKVLVSQMTAWPRMLIAGMQLPPFIHPPCATDLSISDCPPEATAHLCLPKTLAICASLLQMFYTRTPGSCDFVWEQIYAHQATLHNDYMNYDVLTLLDALQTTILYLLLQAQDTESIEKNDVLSLLLTTEDIARRFYSMASWRSSALSKSHPTRRDWILLESARRLACVLYEAKVLLILSPGASDELGCTDYVNVPLPCSRELWEPVSNREWETRYRRQMGLKGQCMSQGLGLGDLIFPERNNEPSGPGASRAVEELTTWCENVDEFGMLLWMVAKLEYGN